MFRIECIVDDKNLALVMKKLTGITRELKALPVQAVRMNKDRKDALTAGTLVEQFGRWLKLQRGEVNREYVHDFLGKAGCSPTSYGYLMKSAVEAKLLRVAKMGTGKSIQYVRIEFKPKKAAS